MKARKPLPHQSPRIAIYHLPRALSTRGPAQPSCSRGVMYARTAQTRRCSGLHRNGSAQRLENERTFPRNALHSIPFFFLFLLQFWLQCTAFRDNGYDYDYFLRAKVSMRKRKVGWGDIISKSRWSFRKRTILARLLHIIITEWWHWCHVHYCTALWKNGEGRGL